MSDCKLPPSGVSLLPHCLYRTRQGLLSTLSPGSEFCTFCHQKHTLSPLCTVVFLASCSAKAQSVQTLTSDAPEHLQFYYVRVSESCLLLSWCCSPLTQSRKVRQHGKSGKGEEEVRGTNVDKRWIERGRVFAFHCFCCAQSAHRSTRVSQNTCRRVACDSTMRRRDNSQLGAVTVIKVIICMYMCGRCACKHAATLLDKTNS